MNCLKFGAKPESKKMEYWEGSIEILEGHVGKYEHVIGHIKIWRTLKTAARTNIPQGNTTSMLPISLPKLLL